MPHNSHVFKVKQENIEGCPVVIRTAPSQGPSADEKSKLEECFRLSQDCNPPRCNAV